MYCTVCTVHVYELHSLSSYHLLSTAYFLLRYARPELLGSIHALTHSITGNTESAPILCYLLIFDRNQQNRFVRRGRLQLDSIQIKSKCDISPADYIT